MRPTPPPNLDELLARARALSGLSLETIAARYEVSREDPHKGWSGQLIEIALGASAGSKPEPDFLHLGVELKTLPIHRQGRPLESTFVCAMPRKTEIHWRESSVYRKLAKVLWIPIVSERSIPLLERQVGAPILWSPSDIEEAVLKEDWEELCEMYTLGHADKLHARYGTALQLRPKAAHSRVLIETCNEDGELTLINPFGFYLRANFTEKIVRG